MICVSETMLPTRYKALLLDFYGTLVKEDDEIINRIVTVIADSSPVTSDPKHVLDSWDFSGLCSCSYGPDFKTQRALELESLLHLLEEYEADIDAKELSEELFSYWRSPEAYPFSSPFLRKVGLPVCIVSNIDSADLAGAISFNGWKFQHIVTSESCRAYKPRPEPFLTSLQCLGLTTDEVLHVGDSLSVDVAGANRLGIDCVWINRKNRPIPPDGPCRPTYVVADTDEITHLLK